MTEKLCYKLVIHQQLLKVLAGRNYNPQVQPVKAHNDLVFLHVVDMSQDDIYDCGKTRNCVFKSYFPRPKHSKHK